MPSNYDIVLVVDGDVKVYGLCCCYGYFFLHRFCLFVSRWNDEKLEGSRKQSF